MTTQIIPDYLRHTEFAPEERFDLEGYARAHGFLMGQYIHAKQMLKGLEFTYGNAEKVASMQRRVDRLQELMVDIEEEVKKIYIAHGRVN